MKGEFDGEGLARVARVAAGSGGAMGKSALTREVRSMVRRRAHQLSIEMREQLVRDMEREIVLGTLSEAALPSWRPAWGKPTDER
jgi:hypothetical protein